MLSSLPGGRQASPRGRKVIDDLLRQIWETVNYFSWLFMAKQESKLAFRGKAWRRPAIHHGRAAAWFDLLTTGGQSETDFPAPVLESNN